MPYLGWFQLAVIAAGAAALIALISIASGVHAITDELRTLNFRLSAQDPPPRFRTVGTLLAEIGDALRRIAERMRH